MSIDVPTLRDELRDHLGQDEFDLPDDKADLLLNRSYWELIDKFAFREKEVTATFQTVAGTRNYDMPSPFEALRQLSVLDPVSQQHRVLKKMTVLEYENSYNESDDFQDIPARYVREKCFARLYPTPDDTYTITLKYWTTLADLSDSNDPEIPQSWHEIILYGAIYRGFLRIGDLNRANQFKAHQNALINSSIPVEAKEEFDTHTAGLDVKWED